MSKHTVTLAKPTEITSQQAIKFTTSTLEPIDAVVSLSRGIVRVLFDGQQKSIELFPPGKTKTATYIVEETKLHDALKAMIKEAGDTGNI